MSTAITLSLHPQLERDMDLACRIAAYQYNYSILQVPQHETPFFRFYNHNLAAICVSPLSEADKKEQLKTANVYHIKCLHHHQRRFYFFITSLVSTVILSLGLFLLGNISQLAGLIVVLIGMGGITAGSIKTWQHHNQKKLQYNKREKIIWKLAQEHVLAAQSFLCELIQKLVVPSPKPKPTLVSSKSEPKMRPKSLSVQLNVPPLEGIERLLPVPASLEKALHRQYSWSVIKGFVFEGDIKKAQESVQAMIKQIEPLNFGEMQEERAIENSEDRQERAEHNPGRPSFKRLCYAKAIKKVVKTHVKQLKSSYPWGTQSVQIGNYPEIVFQEDSAFQPEEKAKAEPLEKRKRVSFSPQK